jgi:hypothetical protein
MVTYPVVARYGCFDASTAAGATCWFEPTATFVEQDHRAIKRRCASMAGFKSFANAAVTIAGIELAHRIRKRQYMLSRPYRRLSKWPLKKEWAIGPRLN